MSGQADVRRSERPGDRWLIADGDLRARWRDVTLTGSHLYLDEESRWLRLDGDVRALLDDGSYLETDYYALDLENYWSFTGPFQGELSPEMIGYGAVQPLRLQGEDSLSLRDYYFSAHRVLITSCPPDDLKYHLTARTVAVVPNRKIILRSARIFLFGVPIFAWGKLVIPLHQYRRTEWLPEFGRNDTYGYYARMRYYYDLADSQLGNVLGMMTEKRGMFLGLEHEFGYGRGEWRGIGDIDLEYGTRNAELSLRGSVDQGMGTTTSLRVNGAYSRNSGFSSTTSQSNVTALFNTTYGLGNTSLTYNRTQSDSANLRSVFTRYGLNQRLSIGPTFAADLSADMSTRQLSTAATDHELNTTARLTGRWSLFDWELLDQRRFDLEGSSYPADDNRATTEIVPQLTLKTDSRRWNPFGVPDLLDLQLDTSVGQLREFVTNTDGSADSRSTVLRVNFDLNGRLGRVALSPRTRFLADVRYSQSFFDHPNPAAKYILSGSPRFEWKPSRHTRLDLGYRWQEVSGFSPLSRYDFAQTINDLDYGLTIFWPHPARQRNGLAQARVSGGYDFLTGRPRDVRIAAAWQPIHEVYVNLNTSYVLGGQGAGEPGLRTVRGQFLFETGPRYQHEIGLTYDPRDGQFDSIDSLLTWEPLHHLILQNALTWEGRNQRVTYNDLLTTLDMGCVQLVGSYRQSVGEYRLDLNITAFPGLASLFGTGRTGQQFSTSQGFSF